MWFDARVRPRRVCRAGFPGGVFMIMKDLLLQGVLNPSRSWRTLGMLHDREDFCPISGGKTLRDHGRTR
jgi:hypothetical protein